ncbi:MAG TPA: site-2 protease family protein [Pyrinomonadaceae bacterium]|nr:site-2 protease family protein [Pyrinomonadaceae bacterium]
MSETLHPLPPLVEHRTAWVRQATRPTAREWMRHAGLFALTALTATLAGIMQAAMAAGIPEVEPSLAAPSSWIGYLFYVPAYYFLSVRELLRQALLHTELIAQGATFAASLLSILLAHEAGHYVACRRYGVNATLPFFIPAPPLFLAGTFGAFIKIKSPIPTRRALFDIGVAGPLAGFVLIIPVALLAVLTSQPAPPLPETAATTGTFITFNDPLLLRLCARALGIDLTNIAPNPFYFAAWIGLLVTSLNLLPVGQLDGGHAVYALFGKRMHAWIGRLGFVSMALLAVLGWYWHNSPGGFLYALLLFVMLRVPHPQAMDESAPLGRARTIVAILTLTVFLLSFVLFPITIS